MLSLVSFIAVSSRKNNQKENERCHGVVWNFHALHVPLICLFFLLLSPRTSLFNAPDVYSLNNYVIEIQGLLSGALH